MPWFSRRREGTVGGRGDQESENGTATALDVATGEECATFPIATDGPYQGFVFSPDRKTLGVEGTHVEEKKLPNGTSYSAVYRIHLFDVEG